MREGYTFGIGGVYMFSCKPLAGENGEEMNNLVRHMLSKFRVPYMIVCDNAPYNRVFTSEDGDARQVRRVPQGLL
jgi:hypothetical protein